MGTIKSFKKFIEESIWSDIQDRSSGDTVRKEDDINNLDLNEFYTYIKDQYKTKVEYIDLVAMGGENGDVLGVDITENVILFYKPKRGHILLSWSRVKIPMPFFDELTDRFKVENPNAMRKIITEKDGSCTNKTFVDVIDFFLGHKGTIMNESIWSDIQDRSAGDTVRKEDEYDIDEKELERSVDTCIKTYVIGFIYYDKYDGSSDTFLKYIQEWNRNICQNAQLYDRRFGKYVEPIKVIPSYVKKNWETGKSYKSLVDKKMSEEEKKVKDTGFIKKPGESISDTLSKWFDENFEKLGDDFCEEIEEYNEMYHNEGGSMSVDLGVEDWWDNLEYIEQVEIYQDYMKKTNESIWSDIQDRSAGDTVRKEDERHIYLERLLATYIKLFAEGCYCHDEYAYSSYPDFISYIKDFRDNPRIEEVCPNNSYFDDLLDYVNKETWDNQIFDTIVEISQRIVHGEHPITDDVIKELRKHNVNESIWSDIQDRSMGKTVRKEDDVNLFDYDGLYNYIKSKYSGKLFYIDKDYFGQGGETICVDPIEKVSLFLKRLKDGSLEHILLSWASVDIDDSFLLKLEERFFVSSPNVKRRIIKEKDGTCTNKTYIDVIDFFLEHIDSIAINESIWSDIQDRSMGKTVRKEDEMNDDDFLMLRATAKMFRVGVRNYSNPKKRKYTLKRIDGCDGFIDYILEKKKEHFWNDTPDEAYDKVIRFVKKNWGDCTGIQEFMDKYLSNINECDGVPGGLTPADVGGMGPAYFPGPNGEPGSGDLPSPTGIVYKQVAPFDTFIKIRKQKKKKKKKFRIEDEPCAHSKNPKIYDHVDDFRDYVDRVYNNIDKRK